MREIPRDHRDDGCAVRAAGLVLALSAPLWVLALAIWAVAR